MTTDDLYLRQRGILSPDDLTDIKITLIGAGGIGSPTAITLGKMGFPDLTVFDHDKVELHNLSNQFYRIQDIGKWKVDALRSVIMSYTPDMEVTGLRQKFDGNQSLKGIVISAVDSMESRQTVWDSVKGNANVRFYIEARMGAEFLRLYAFDPSDARLAIWYEQMLYPDAEAAPDLCTERAVMYTVMVVGGFIANLVKKHVQGEEIKKETLFDLKNLELVVQ